MGAYNVIDLAFEVTRTLTLPFISPGASDRELELINAEYDAASSTSLGRGLGDCGCATRWQFDGTRFVLAECAEESTCDAWHSSDDWPTLWVSQSDGGVQQR